MLATVLDLKPNRLHVAALLHDELGVVMAKTWQQLSASPLQEVVEGVGGTLLHPDLIPVAPDLQTGQCNADVQRTVELKQTDTSQLGCQIWFKLVYWELRALTQSTWLATSSMR